MKKLTTLLLAIILCFSLEACGTKTDLVPNSQEGHTQETSQKETEETNPESSNVGVGSSQPYFVGNNGPFFVGKLGANQ